MDWLWQQQSKAEASVSAYDFRTEELTKPVYLAPRAPRPSSAPTASAANSTSEKQELKELHDMFGSARQSALPASVYSQYSVSVDNLAKAEQARAERMWRDQQRQDMARKQHEETQERRSRVRGRNEKAKRDLESRNLALGRTIRQHREQIKHEIEKRQQQLHMEVKARVDEQRGGYSSFNERLAAEEGERSEEIQQHHARAREARQMVARGLKQQWLEERKQRAEVLRESTAQKVSQALAESNRKKVESAEDKKAAALKSHEAFAICEDERLHKVEEIKARALASRTNAVLVRQKLAKQKQQEVARHIEETDERVKEARARVLGRNQEKRRAVFSSRYATRDEAERYVRSDFRRLHAIDAGDAELDAEIDLANVEIFERIATVKQRTDDDIDDEAAGEARIRLAEESRERQAAEASRIEQENASMKERLKGVKAATRAVLREAASAKRRTAMEAASRAGSKAGTLALEARALSKARRPAAALAIETRDQELQARLKSVQKPPAGRLTNKQSNSSAHGRPVSGWFW
jgi:hypothetical protein